MVKPNTACTFRFSVAFSPHKMSQSIKKLIVSNIKFNNLSSCTSRRCLFSGFYFPSPPLSPPICMRCALYPFGYTMKRFENCKPRNIFVYFTHCCCHLHTHQRERERGRERGRERERKEERDDDRVAVASWHFAFLAGK